MIGDLINAGASLINGWMNRNDQQRNAEAQMAMQKEFAQSGIQWKVNDAKAAGIHPLAALGAQTSSYSPQTIGETSFGDMGQSLGRAAKAAMSKEDRQAEELKSLSVERARLDNDLVRSQINASRAATTSRASGAIGPAMPKMTVDGDPIKTDDIKQKPSTAPAVEKLRVGGLPVRTNPYMSDAQDIEDRYGEAVSDYVVGPLNTIGDGAYTVYRKFKDNQGYAPARSFIRGLTRAGRR